MSKIAILGAGIAAHLLNIKNPCRRTWRHWNTATSIPLMIVYEEVFLEQFRDAFSFYTATVTFVTDYAFCQIYLCIIN